MKMCRCPGPRSFLTRTTETGPAAWAARLGGRAADSSRAHESRCVLRSALRAFTTPVLLDAAARLACSSSDARWLPSLKPPLADSQAIATLRLGPCPTLLSRPCATPHRSPLPLDTPPHSCAST